MKILLSNDDGVHAEGLWALHEAVSKLGDTVVVAPEREQSASSHALTLHHPLRVREVRERVFAVDGTPTDCILLAIRGIPEVLDFAPDLVLSGINHGPNLGDDVGYSGTVAAAFEGHLLKRPAIAFSNVAGRRGLPRCARAARRLVELLQDRPLPSSLLLNVNFPDPGSDAATFAGFRVTRLGKRVYSDVVVHRVDPRGRPYYWIGGEPSWDPDEASDMFAVRENYVSVTPMHLDLTDTQKLEEMRGWELPLR